jgi:hypothetical protein
MQPVENRVFVCTRRTASPREFVEFWERAYRDENEPLYTQNIRGPHTEETLLHLFHWKMGSVYFKTEKMLRSVRENFISQAERARGLPQNISAKEFLEAFPNGGPIYRIFWLHCWYPERFPIYDQHVHRGMVFIREGQLEELDLENRKTIDSYLGQYLPFYEPFATASKDLAFDEERDGIRTRKADRALWTFGEFLKTAVGEAICDLHP